MIYIALHFSDRYLPRMVPSSSTLSLQSFHTRNKYRTGCRLKVATEGVHGPGAILEWEEIRPIAAHEPVFALRNNHPNCQFVEPQQAV